MDRSSVPYLIGFFIVFLLGLFLGGILGIAIAIIGVLLLFFTIFFFRDPKRSIPEDEDAIVSPADGVVIGIDDYEVESISGGKRLSIFMSPLDVHINRAPVDGDVVSVKHFSGKFHRAFEESASLENERVDMLLSSSRGNIFIRQIAGIIARRIICRAKSGDVLKRGEKYGIIHFGSRVEIVIPPNANFVVGDGDRVVGGETIIARWRNKWGE